MRVFIVLTLIGAACAVPRQSNRIVGGESTNIENYPFMASMLLRIWEGYIQSCGGTLITNTAVVSAAHCYALINPYAIAWRVNLGSRFAHSGGEFHTVSKLILHAKFSQFTFLNDVAIVKLTVPTVFSNTIKAARIAGPRYILPDNTLVHVAGWGDTEFEGMPSEELKHVAVYTINHQLCTERYAYLKTQPDTRHMPLVTPEMFCAGILDVGGKDGCQGDSGGPVIHGGDILVGITSWGYQCAHKTYPGVNVRVPSYTDWIYNNSISYESTRFVN